MIVQPLQPAAIDWAAAAAGTMAGPWKPGSIVSGRVLEYLEGALMVLQIAGLTVKADRPSRGLMPRQFQARVLNGGPQPLLEVLAHASQGPPTAAALRARLPQQGGLQPLLADLRAMARIPGARTLPEPVRLALARLEASIADHHDVLDPDLLRNTLERAGLQLEHNLLQRARAPAQWSDTRVDYDLKAALQRLAQVLQRLPPPVSPRAVSPGTVSPGTVSPERASPAPATTDPAPPPLLRLPLQPQARLPATIASDPLELAAGMLKHVQGALARIEIMQLEAHPAGSPQACMLEVPVRDNDGLDVIQVRIEQEAGNAQAPDIAHWTLGFTLEPRGLGAIHGNIRLRGAQVNVDLWAEHDAAAQALEEQTSVLARLLEGSGLQLVQLRVRQGSPLRYTGLGRTLLEASA